MRIQPKSFFLGVAVGLIPILIVRLIPALYMAFLELLFVSSPHTEVEQALSSPDGRYVAYVLVRDSGATTAPSRHVAVAPTGQRVPEVGNVLRARGPGSVSVRWEDAQEVLVTSEAEVRFFDAMADGAWATLRLRAAPAEAAGDEQREERSPNMTMEGTE